MIRKFEHASLFDLPAPNQQEIADARFQDQQELALFHQQLAQILAVCNNLTDHSNTGRIPQVKAELDSCYIRACSLGADLNEQKEALSYLNDVITSALRRALRDDDEPGRFKLIKQESLRVRQIESLSHTVVADILRDDSPIASTELAATLLCESDAAFLAAAHMLSTDRRQTLAAEITAIGRRLSVQSAKSHKTGAIQSKLALLATLSKSGDMETT